MPLFAGSGGGCSGPGPGRAVAGKGFSSWLPGQWCSLSARLELRSDFSGWGYQIMGEEENEWKEHTTDPCMGLGSEDRSLLPLFIPTDLASVK